MEKHIKSDFVQEETCGVLRRLACDGDNDRLIAQLGGIPLLISVMKEHIEKPAIQEEASWALANLSGRHGEVAKQVISAGAQDAMQIAKDKYGDVRPEIVSAVLAFERNCSTVIT